MNLKKGGLVYEVLEWYGYPDWRLEEGVSLCKTFWSIMLGIVLLAPGRGILWIGEQIEARFGRKGVAVAWMLVASLATFTVLLELGGSWRDAALVTVIALGFLLGLFVFSIGVVAVFRAGQDRYENE